MATPLAEREALNLQPRHRWTVAEYHRMGEVGLLHEDSRVELIDGEIIEMAPIGSAHGGNVKRFIRLFSKVIGNKAIIAAQDPVVLSGYAEPQPDISILRWRADDYEQSNPHPEDVLLLIEVSDSTLRYDRDVKIPLYAKNGIPEVWLLDIPNRKLEIYREPINGEYRQRDCRQTGQIAPILCPDAVIDLAELFPKT
ncbi:MAG: Uma2 family endonuclease [Candidatus Contendobacter sp.]|nr:Uma2 family endonuclease [Candidatus Contendobacter sp.]MDS4057642.1 Uma2 family endonuclease [Candidatus Contendobacter sp.]